MTIVLKLNPVVIMTIIIFIWWLVSKGNKHE